MNKIVLIFCFLTINILHASNRPIDSVYNPAFQKEVGFYLKYGTIDETQKILQKLTILEQENKESNTSLHQTLSQSSADYIDANNRIVFNSNMLNCKTVTHVDLHKQITQAQQDACNAWYAFQANSCNKTLSEQETVEINLKKQALINRRDRLIVRSKERTLTAKQQAFQEQQRQAHLEQAPETISKKSDTFRKKQEKIKPLLNRVMRQSLHTQTIEAPSENLLGNYIAQAKQQSKFTEEKKQKKALLQAQKDREIKIFQSLAMQKGTRQTIIPTQAQRAAQSKKDKEATREQQEINFMGYEDKTKVIMLPVIQHEKQICNKPSSSENIQKSIIDQNNLDAISMLLSRLQSQKNFTFDIENPQEESNFSTITLELEKTIDQHPQLFEVEKSSSLRCECMKTIKDNLKSYREKLKSIQDKAPQELINQERRSQEIDSLSTSQSLDKIIIRRLLTLGQEQKEFINLIKQDTTLRSVIKTVESLEKKLKNFSMKNEIKYTYLEPRPQDSPFFNYIQKQKEKDEALNRTKTFINNKPSTITKAHTARPKEYELHQDVYDDIRKKIFDITSPDFEEKEAISGVISKEVKR